MRKSNRENAKQPDEGNDRKDASVVVPLRPKPVPPRRPSRGPDDPGPDTAA